MLRNYRNVRTLHLKYNNCLDVWEVFSKVFGGRIWVASAYKGATGPCMTVTDINYHVENQKEWLRLVNRSIKPNAAHFRGYALTGWQR